MDDPAEEQRAARVQALQLATRLMDRWTEQELPLRPLAEAFLIVGSSALSAADGPEEASQRLRRIVDGFDRGRYAAQ
jgi:hypothetical protein